MNYPTSFPVLQTARLRLRELQPTDADNVFAMYSHPEVTRYWSRLPMTDPAEGLASIERSLRFASDQTALTWAITRPHEDALIGCCTLFDFHIPNRRAQVGYSLCRDAWGQGYMHEALAAVLGYAFGPLQLRRIEADIDPRNHASVRTLERHGFSREGLLRERWQVGDEISDSLLMGLLAREWVERIRD